MAFYDELYKWGSRICCIDESGRSITYSGLDHIVEEIGEIIRPGSLVFVFCHNSIGAVAGYTAFLRYKAVPVLLNAGMERGSRENLTGIYKPAFVYAPVYMKDYFTGCECIWEDWDYCLLSTGYEAGIEFYPELALLLTTSGSTGSPRLVRQSYKNINANTCAIAEYLKLDESERPITTLPMNYTYGLSVINSHLLAGAALLLTDKSVMQREFWQFFKKERATSLAGVPYTYEMLAKLRFFRMDLPSLKTMTQAGGKLSAGLHKKFAGYARDNDKKFIVMYGQCEATARMGFLPAEMALEKCGSMGVAIPGGRFYLIGGEGDIIDQPNVTGELVYEGDNVTLGYADCIDDLAKGDERNGVLYTGDMAEYDEDGYYYIVGRRKRFLKIYGNRVNLDEVDRLLKDHFKDIDCVSAGVDDHMYIFITEGELADEVREFAALKTGLNHAAFKVAVLDEIPRNDAGKTLYSELERYYEQDGF